MPRPKEKVLDKLREQMDFLLTSLSAFYEGQFAESVRIATIVRVLVYESGMCKPLLTQARPDGLDLQILEHADEAKPDEEEIFSFAVSMRMGPGPTLSPAVDLGSSHHTMRWSLVESHRFHVSITTWQAVDLYEEEDRPYACQ